MAKIHLLLCKLKFLPQDICFYSSQIFSFYKIRIFLKPIAQSTSSEVLFNFKSFVVDLMQKTTFFRWSFGVEIIISFALRLGRWCGQRFKYKVDAFNIMREKKTFIFTKSQVLAVVHQIRCIFPTVWFNIRHLTHDG